MRIFDLPLLAALLVPLASSLQLPEFQPFLAALPQALQDYLPAPVSNASAHEVLKRQYSNTCPTGYKSCQSLGVPALCCNSKAVCSPDAAGNVACCPSGAVCTGVITGVITAGTVGGNGQLITSGATGAVTSSFQNPTTTGNGLVQASTQTTAANGGAQTTSGSGFIYDGSSTVASPAGAMRGSNPPAIARAIIHLLQYLPV